MPGVVMHTVHLVEERIRRLDRLVPAALSEALLGQHASQHAPLGFGSVLLAEAKRLFEEHDRAGELSTVAQLVRERGVGADRLGRADRTGDLDALLELREAGLVLAELQFRGAEDPQCGRPDLVESQRLRQCQRVAGDPCGLGVVAHAAPRPGQETEAAALAGEGSSAPTSAETISR